MKLRPQASGNRTQLSKFTWRNQDPARAARLAGQCCRYLNDIDGAIDHPSRAAKLKKDSPPIFLALGIAFQLNTQWDDAIEVFRRAIEIDSD